MESFFDGRVMTGDDAHQRGLVDRVGYLDDAIAIAQSMGGLKSDSSVIMYRRDNDRAYTALDVTPNHPTQMSFFPVNLPGLDRSMLPTFLYLWQPDPSFATSAGT